MQIVQSESAGKKKHLYGYVLKMSAVCLVIQKEVQQKSEK